MGRVHSDEVRTYVVHRRLEGAQHNEIIGEVKAKFNEVVSDSWIYAAFREAGHTRKQAQATTKTSDSAIHDYVKLRQRIAHLKTANKGDTVTCLEYTCEDGGKPKPKAVEATVIRCYKTYIHTDKGCVQYTDIMGLKRSWER